MVADYRELLIGCGFSREKMLSEKTDTAPTWKNLTTLDYESSCKPDWICDLRLTPWRYFSGEDLVVIQENSFDEIHAYEVLEHLGVQGDVSSFFDTFNEIHRILKPNGVLYATTPSRYSAWLWADPGHCRAILQESLVFLDRDRWSKNNAKKSPIADYRRYTDCDFDVIASSDNHVRHIFALRAVKPVREWGHNL